MIHGFALVGAVAGIGFVVLAAWSARVIGRKERLKKTPPESWCGLRSPDDKLVCCQEMSHAGWCQNGAAQWRQGVWYARPEGDDPLVTEIPKPDLGAGDFAWFFSLIGYAVLVVVLFVHACYEQVVS